MYAAGIFRLIYTFDIHYWFCFLLLKVISRLYRHCLTNRIHHLPRVVKDLNAVNTWIWPMCRPSGNDLRFYSSRTKWNKIAKTAIWISVSGYDRFLFDWLTDRFQWNLIVDVFMSLGTFKHWMQIVCGILRAKKSWWKINKTSIWNYHFFNFPWFFVNSNEH